MSGGDVVVVGSLNVDIAGRVARHPGPGETVLATSGVSSPGGKGANQAVAAALSGARVRMVGATGSDPYAEIATGLLRRAGVDLSLVRRVEGEATGLALITVADDGENSIVVIPGANGTVGAADVGAAAPTWTASTVLVLQCEVPVEALLAAADRIAAAGGRLVFNLAPVVPVPPRLITQSDPLVVNEHEAASALAMLTPATADVALDPRQIVTGLIGAGVPSVVCTLGGEGALVADGSTVDHLPALPVDVVDTTGAGDSFVGTIAAHLAAGDGLAAAAEAATAVAARAVGRRGAQESYDWDAAP